MALGTQSDTNRVLLRLRAEATYKTPPGGTYDELPFTGEGLVQENRSQSSDTVSSKRRTTDVFRQEILARGPTRGNMQFAAFDPILPACLFSAGYSTPGSDIVSTTIGHVSKATAGGAAEITSTGGILAPVPLYAIILVSGATTNGTNVCKVTAKPDNDTLEVVVISRTADFVDEASGDSVTIQEFAQIVDGITCTSFTMEREYTDLTATFAQFVGMVPDTIALEWPADNRATIEVNWLGSNETEPTPNATDASATNAVPTTKIMRGNSVGNVILENGRVVEWTRFRMSHANQLRNRTAGGVEGAISVGAGRGQTEGQLEIYHEDDPPVVADANGFVESNILASFIDETPAGSPTGPNYLVVDIPSMHFTQASRPANAGDQDVILTLPWIALENVAQDTQVRIAKLAGA